MKPKPRSHDLLTGKMLTLIETANIVYCKHPLAPKCSFTEVPIETFLFTTLGRREWSALQSELYWIYISQPERIRTCIGMSWDINRYRDRQMIKNKCLKQLKCKSNKSNRRTSNVLHTPLILPFQPPLLNRCCPLSSHPFLAFQGRNQKERILTPNHLSDLIYSDPSITTSTALENNITKLCNFIKEDRINHQETRATIKGIKLVYAKM